MHCGDDCVCGGDDDDGDDYDDDDNDDGMYSRYGYSAKKRRTELINGR